MLSPSRFQLDFRGQTALPLMVRQDTATHVACREAATASPAMGSFAGTPAAYCRPTLHTSDGRRASADTGPRSRSVPFPGRQAASRFDSGCFRCSTTYEPRTASRRRTFLFHTVQRNLGSSRATSRLSGGGFPSRQPRSEATVSIHSMMLRREPLSIRAAPGPATVQSELYRVPRSTPRLSLSGLAKLLAVGIEQIGDLLDADVVCGPADQNGVGGEELGDVLGEDRGHTPDPRSPAQAVGPGNTSVSGALGDRYQRWLIHSQASPTITVPAAVPMTCASPLTPANIATCVSRRVNRPQRMRSKRSPSRPCAWLSG